MRKCALFPLKNLNAHSLNLKGWFKSATTIAWTEKGEPSWQEFKSRGVPVKNITYINGKVARTHKIISIDKTKIGLEKFKIPKGYKKTEMPKIPQK